MPDPRLTNSLRIIAGHKPAPRPIARTPDQLLSALHRSLVQATIELAQCATDNAAQIARNNRLLKSLTDGVTMPDIAERVRRIIARKFDRDVADCADHVRIHDLAPLGADSLDLIEISFDIGDELGTWIDDDEQDRWTTVGDVIRSVERHTKGDAPVLHPCAGEGEYL